nr:MAG: putative RNA dependent RNA polymerase [Hattula totivirus 3]
MVIAGAKGTTSPVAMALGLSKTLPPDQLVPHLRYWRAGGLLHDHSLLEASPLVPTWMLHPEVLGDEKMEVLKVVEEAYIAHYLGYETYDKWMGLNSGDYQLGSNPALMTLWEERLLAIDVMSEEEVDRILIKGSHVAARRTGEEGDSTRGLGLNHWLSVKTIGFRIKPCKRGGHHIEIVGRAARSRRHWKPLNCLYPWTEFEDKQKTNLDLASLIFQGLQRGHHSRIQEALNIMPVGMSNTMCTAVVAAAIGNPEWSRFYALCQEDGVCCSTLPSLKAYFKGISTAVRRLGRWVDGSIMSVAQVSATAYFELSIGRAANLTDWAEELAKRCGPELPLKDPYTGEDFMVELESHIRDIIIQMLPTQDVWGTWSNFISARQKWSPAGSAAGARCEVEGTQIRVNKHSFFEMTPTADVLKWLDSPPELRARGSEKLEAGKARAIYGTAPCDQTIVTYVIGPLERGMGKVREFINGHTGAHEVADLGRRLHNVAQEGVECTMLDYADFNYQHTLPAQELLFRVVATELARYGNSDLDKAAEWVREAQLHQYVKVPDDTQWHRVTQGMFSGVRSTDFTNTILNLAYFNTARAKVLRHTGLVPIGLMNLHKGDDVWITNRSRLWASELYRSMAAAGFVFQGSKQMFDRDRGEFLRVLYTSEGAVGYMMRAVATLLVKPIQSIMEMAPQNKATAITSQIHLLYRRGFSSAACDVLWWAIIPRALRLKLPGGAGVGIPVGIASKGYQNGGLDLGPPMTAADGGIGTQPLPAPVPYTKKLEAAIPHFMSHDWIKEVAKVVQGPINTAALEEALHAANVTDSLRPEDRLMSMRRLEKDLKTWWLGIADNGGNWRGHRVPLELSVSKNIPVVEVALRLNHSLLCYEVVGREPGAPLNIVDTLMAGIAASPLRDVASAKMALGLSTLSAARECLKLASGRPIARKASLWLESLVIGLGAEITASILDGIRGVGVSFEALLHPIVLSLICKRATDCAIISASADKVRTRQDWDTWLSQWMVSLTSQMVQEHRLDEWSHY